MLVALDLVTGGRPDGARARRVVAAAQEAGLLLLTGGAVGHVIEIGPPLTIAPADLQLGVDRLSAALASVPVGEP